MAEGPIRYVQLPIVIVDVQMNSEEGARSWYIYRLPHVFGKDHFNLASGVLLDQNVHAIIRSCWRLESQGGFPQTQVRKFGGWDFIAHK
jgi:hypothetical protein